MMERLSHISRRLVTFCAIAVLFLGSLFYFSTVAFKTRAHTNERQENIQGYIDAL